MKHQWMVGLAGLFCIACGGTIWAYGVGEICTAPFTFSAACPATGCVNVVANPKQCNGGGPFVAYNAYQKPGTTSGVCTWSPSAICSSALCRTRFYNLVGLATCATSTPVCDERLPLNNGECL